MLDTKALAAATAAIVKEHVDKAVAPLLARIGELERTIESQPAELEAFMEGRIGEERKWVLVEAKALIEEGETLLMPRVKTAIDDAVAIGLGDAMLDAAAKAIAELPKPADGHSPTPEELAPLIDESVRRAVSAIPAPKDGKDGVDGKDGAGLVDLLIDRAGELVTTLSDGRIKNVGRVVGRNGKDGAPGKDGRDGFGFDDMTDELADDGRTIIRRYSRGEDVKEFRHKMAVVLYRGVWKEGQSYDAGDNVTWGGHSWIAKEDTDAKPEPNGGPWILHVKRGRDGKDGMLKAEKPKEPVKVG